MPATDEFSVDYCNSKAAPPGSNLYYSTLFLPVQVKTDLHILHAFATEINDVVEECSDPGVARVKLSWWMEEILRIFENQARHPVGKAMTELKSRYEITKELLVSLLNYSEDCINPEQPETFEQLLSLLQKGSGKLWEMTAIISKFRDQDTFIVSSRVGSLVALLDILQNSRQLLLKERNYFPRDEMNNAGITTHHLLDPLNKASREFLAFQVERIVSHTQDCKNMLSKTDYHSQLHVLIMMNLILKICCEIRRDGYQIMDHHLSLTPIRKLWVAWITKIFF